MQPVAKGDGKSNTIPARESQQSSYVANLLCIKAIPYGYWAAFRRTSSKTSYIRRKWSSDRLAFARDHYTGEFAQALGSLDALFNNLDEIVVQRHDNGVYKKAIDAHLAKLLQAIHCQVPISLQEVSKLSAGSIYSMINYLTEVDCDMWMMILITASFCKLIAY